MLDGEGRCPCGAYADKCTPHEGNCLYASTLYNMMKGEVRAMLVKCDTCGATYDDEFRTTICPHGTFAANDGKNNFAHHPESMISTDDGFCPCGKCAVECTPYGKDCLYEYVNEGPTTLG